MTCLAAHELNHAARILGGPGIGETLLDAFSSEGRADVFASSIVVPAAAQAPWDQALTVAQEGAWWRAAQPKLVNRDRRLHTDWLFGGQGVPRWTAYTVGCHIAGVQGNATRPAPGPPSHVLRQRMSWRAVNTRSGTATQALNAAFPTVGRRRRTVITSPASARSGPPHVPHTVLLVLVGSWPLTATTRTRFAVPPGSQATVMAISAKPPSYSQTLIGLSTSASFRGSGRETEMVACLPCTQR